MPIGVRIAVGVFAIGCAALAVLGDPVWGALGVPRMLGRVVVICVVALAIAGVIGWITLGERRERRRAERDADIDATNRS
jgi:hypothetical protein